MTDPHAFAPPPERQGASNGVLTIMICWGLTGALLGAVFGSLLDMTGTLEQGISLLALPCAFGLAAIGGLAAWADASWSRDRPTHLIEARRGLSSQRPQAAWLYGVPLALAIPGAMAMGVVATVAVNHPIPAVVFGMMVLSLLWGGRKVMSRSLLVQALDDLATGSIEEGERRLESLSLARWVAPAARASAQVSLGASLLRRGHLLRALEAYQLALQGPGRGPAWAGYAFTALLLDRLDEAEAAVCQASMVGTPRDQPQVDCVRVLLAWRREGPASALALGEQVLHPGMGGLLAALVGTLRGYAGDQEGAQRLLTDAIRADIEQQGLLGLVPELNQ